MLDLYNEQAGILDDGDDDDVDLASYAYQIWQKAVELDPSLERKIPALPGVSFAARQHIAVIQDEQEVFVLQIGRERAENGCCGSSRTPNSAATAWGILLASTSVANSTSHTPSAKVSITAVATS